MALNLLQHVHALLRRGNDLNDAVHEIANRFELSDETRFALTFYFL